MTRRKDNCRPDRDSGALESRVPSLRRPHRRTRSKGQTLAEFAIVVPILIALLGGIIQFGMVFWAQNTLTQVVRDTGRWAATQQTNPCNTGTTPSGQTGVQALAAEANTVAANSSLIGYTANEWSVLQDYTANTNPDSSIASAPNAEGIYVAWVNDAQPPSPAPPQSCPPTTNQAVWHVTIRIDHSVPIFMPGLQYLPGLGTCDTSGCHVMLSSTAQFRMEPAPLGLGPASPLGQRGAWIG